MEGANVCDNSAGACCYRNMDRSTGHEISLSANCRITAIRKATQNNSKITSQYDAISAEEVTYAYDALNRLASAVTTDNPNVTQWGQSYNYDGFGNLTDQNVTKGSAPSMHVVYNAAT